MKRIKRVYSSVLVDQTSSFSRVSVILTLTEGITAS